jgi:mRNA-degrading endonuclease RelE of RelBE toxin-antitoxin system
LSLTVQWKSTALKDLERLDPPIRKRVVAAVQRFAELGQGDALKLSDKTPSEYRLRVSGWRVRFAWNQAAGILTVLGVFSRGQGYE